MDLLLQAAEVPSSAGAGCGGGDAWREEVGTSTTWKAAQSLAGLAGMASALSQQTSALSQQTSRRSRSHSSLSDVTTRSSAAASALVAAFASSSSPGEEPAGLCGGRERSWSFNQRKRRIDAETSTGCSGDSHADEDARSTTSASQRKYSAGSREEAFESRITHSSFSASTFSASEERALAQGLSMLSRSAPASGELHARPMLLDVPSSVARRRQGARASQKMDLDDERSGAETPHVRRDKSVSQTSSPSDHRDAACDEHAAPFALEDAAAAPSLLDARRSSLVDGVPQPLSLDQPERPLLYEDLINFPRSRGKAHARRCVMCGHLASGEGATCSIPLQNKDVCKRCDTGIWHHRCSSEYFKWCKGCKKFLHVCSFAEKLSKCTTKYSKQPSKCDRCRERGRQSYMSKRMESEPSP